MTGSGFGGDFDLLNTTWTAHGVAGCAWLFTPDLPLYWGRMSVSAIEPEGLYRIDISFSLDSLYGCYGWMRQSYSSLDDLCAAAEGFTVSGWVSCTASTCSEPDTCALSSGASIVGTPA